LLFPCKWEYIIAAPEFFPLLFRMIDGCGGLFCCRAARSPALLDLLDDWPQSLCSLLSGKVKVICKKDQAFFADRPSSALVKHS